MHAQPPSTTTSQASPKPSRPSSKRSGAPIQKAVPEANEAIQYGIAAFELRGNLVHFGVFGDHIDIYPLAPGADAVSRDLASYRLGRNSARFHFASRSRVPLIPVIEKQTRSGTARIASIEATALDLCDAPRIAGGMDAAATVLVELAEQPRLSLQKVLALSPHFPAAAARRLGWLLTRFIDRDDLDDLQA